MDAKDAKAEKKGGVWRDRETRAIKRVAFERILLPFPALLPMTETCSSRLGLPMSSRRKLPLAVGETTDAAFTSGLFAADHVMPQQPAGQPGP